MLESNAPSAASGVAPAISEPRAPPHTAASCGAPATLESNSPPHMAASGGAPAKSESNAPPPLHKQKSWSPDTQREAVWSRRKGIHRLRRTRSMSVTDEDLEELWACFELGFGFEPDTDPKLSDMFPALELYYGVNRQHSNSLSRSSSSMTCDSDWSTSSIGGPSIIIDPGDHQEMVKTKLRQWAQLVSFSVRQSTPKK